MMSKAIKNEEDYQVALARLRDLIALDPDAGTPEGDELELLAILVDQYEQQTYQFGTPDPIEAILFRMEQQGLTPQDLVLYIGNIGVVSEILNRKRPLTLEMIRSLHTGLGLPAHVLIQEYTATPN